MEQAYKCPKDNTDMEKVFEDVKEGKITYLCPECYGEFSEWYIEHD